MKNSRKFFSDYFKNSSATHPVFLKKAGIVETREGLDGGYPGNAGAVRAWLWSRSMIRFHVAHFVSP